MISHIENLPTPPNLSTRKRKLTDLSNSPILPKQFHGLTMPSFNLLESQSFYDFCGAVARKVLVKSSLRNPLCDTCTSHINNHSPPDNISNLTSIRTKGKLLFVSLEVFQFLKLAEAKFKSVFAEYKFRNKFLQKALSELVLLPSSSLPTCCNLAKRLLRIFAKYSLAVELRNQRNIIAESTISTKVGIFLEKISFPSMKIKLS